MDFIITIVRFPFGIFAMAFVVGFWLLLFPIEFIIVAILLPLGAVFMQRYELKNSWIGRFPNTLRNLKRSLSSIWDWVQYN